MASSIGGGGRVNYLDQAKSISDQFSDRILLALMRQMEDANILWHGEYHTADIERQQVLRNRVALTEKLKRASEIIRDVDQVKDSSVVLEINLLWLSILRDEQLDCRQLLTVVSRHGRTA